MIAYDKNIKKYLVLGETIITPNAQEGTIFTSNVYIKKNFFLYKIKDKIKNFCSEPEINKFIIVIYNNYINKGYDALNITNKDILSYIIQLDEFKDYNFEIIEKNLVKIQFKDDEQYSFFYDELSKYLEANPDKNADDFIELYLQEHPECRIENE